MRAAAAIRVGMPSHNAGNLSRGEAFHDAFYNEVDTTRGAGCLRVICGHSDSATGPRFDYGKFHHNSSRLFHFRLFHLRRHHPWLGDRDLCSSGRPFQSEHGNAGAERRGYDGATLHDTAQRHADGSNIANNDIADAWQHS